MPDSIASATFPVNFIPAIIVLIPPLTIATGNPIVASKFIPLRLSYILSNRSIAFLAVFFLVSDKRAIALFNSLSTPFSIAASISDWLIGVPFSRLTLSWILRTFSAYSNSSLRFLASSYFA